MGQAVLPQHCFQRVDLGRNIHAHILQQRIIQLCIRLIQRVQNAGDVAAYLGGIGGVRITRPCAVSSSLRVVGR